MISRNDSKLGHKDPSTTYITATKDKRKLKLRSVVPEALQKVHDEQTQADIIARSKCLKPEEIRVLKMQERVRREIREGFEQYDFMINMFKEKEKEQKKAFIEKYGDNSIFGKFYKDPYLAQKKKVELQFESENPRVKNKRMFVSENSIKKHLTNKGSSSNARGLGTLSGQIYRKNQSSERDVYCIKCSPSEERRKFLEERLGLPLLDKGKQNVPVYSSQALWTDDDQTDWPDIDDIDRDEVNSKSKLSDKLTALKLLFEKPLEVQESDFDMETMGIWNSMSTQFKEDYIKSRKSSRGNLVENNNEHVRVRELENEKEMKIPTFVNQGSQRLIARMKSNSTVVEKPKTRTKFVRKQDKDVFELIWDIWHEDERQKKVNWERNREEREREEKLKIINAKTPRRNRAVDKPSNGPSFEAIEEFTQNLRKLKSDDEYYIKYKTHAFHKMLDASSKPRENPFTVGKKKMEREFEKKSPFKTEWMKTFRENYKRAKNLTSAELSVPTRKPRPRSFFHERAGGVESSSLDHWTKYRASKFLQPDQKIPFWQKRTNNPK